MRDRSWCVLSRILNCFKVVQTIKQTSGMHLAEYTRLRKHVIYTHIFRIGSTKIRKTKKKRKRSLPGTVVVEVDADDLRDKHCSISCPSKPNFELDWTP